MFPHLYLQLDLPLIPDHKLRATRRAYHLALTDLRAMYHPVPRRMRRHLEELEESIRRIDEELRARGIGAPPWWANPEAEARAAQSEADGYGAAARAEPCAREGARAEPAMPEGV